MQDFLGSQRVTSGYTGKMAHRWEGMQRERLWDRADIWEGASNRYQKGFGVECMQYQVKAADEPRGWMLMIFFFMSAELCRFAKN